MSISWGHKARVRFEAAGEVNKCAPPAVPAVFAVTFKQDAENKPKAHTVLYFGESADLSREIHERCELVRDNWTENGGRETPLFVFYHPMPNSTLWQRTTVQNQLISEYDPPVNGNNNN
jgi:hypothetical protein